MQILIPSDSLINLTQASTKLIQFVYMALKATVSRNPGYGCAPLEHSICPHLQLGSYSSIDYFLLILPYDGSFYLST